MVINSININKTSLNKTSLINWTHSTQDSPRHMTLEIQVLVWDSHKHLAGLKQLMGSPPSSLDNWITNGITYINKR